MQTGPTVSVIVTSYNYARYIGACIESVLAQTWHELEVIVVDDGSTDNTREVLASFGDAITCIYQRNGGKSRALNTGIARARGRFLAFIDSDDCWLPDSIERRMNVFQSHPDIGVVYGRTEVIDEQGKSLPYYNGSPDRYPGDTFLSLLQGVHIPFLTFMVRRTALEEAGAYFDSAFGATNDWELFLRLARVTRFYYIETPLARYRVHGANWSRNAGTMAREMERLMRRTLAQPGLPASAVSYRPTLLRNLYGNMGLGYLDRGDFRRAAHYFAHSIVVSGQPVWALIRLVYLFTALRAQHHSFGAVIVTRIAHFKRRLNYAATQAHRHPSTLDGECTP